MKKNIIYGKNPVQEALKAKQSIIKLFIAKSSKRSFSALIKLVRQRGIPIRDVEHKKLNELSGSNNHQGIVAIISETKYGSIDDIFIAARQKNEPPLIAILDEIQDPHNLGAIIRSADSFGIHGIIIPKDRAVGLTDVVAKSSAGAIAHVIVARVTNLAQTIDELKKQNLWIVGTDHNATQNISELDHTLALGIVIGSEGKGMRRLITKKCDFLVKIPMFGNVNSLNASVAAAIMFWEIRRKRINK